ncbi:hypothetical protein LEP1GSC034_1384 [Leptospira interrogans str. 2003000735]|nr:hypothetical protein LEP1GSC027_2380 [Leptospira interrogans str. 2002000624]EKQ36339.1 hypothetical protein LEP1GSC025_1295 [Leptospira interrogans str. 2002000621]EKQ49624.1 hypothetical protein LEP1GSC026_4864 [Leptospira interrogans str. 2002000623]EMJ71533.1 hypothetical protein LEP1GSC033_1100 [Leptospira interrogans str. 2002000632]EMJ74819.1 hypothetical protein LEP1GSC034_1384 [Leptospira interrogans str. 2003000735]EMJ83256.1 hypothetical protein LEP1GSC032_1181 [Leptospira interr
MFVKTVSLGSDVVRFQIQMFIELNISVKSKMWELTQI